MACGGPRLRGAAFFCLLSVFGVHGTAVAQSPASPESVLQWGNFTGDLALRLRYEYADWLDPHASDSTSNYSYGYAKLQAGLGYNRDWFKSYLQGQYFQLYDLPDGATGPGGAYFAANSADDYPGDFVLRQGWLSAADESHSLQLGRFIYSNSSESLATDKTVTAIRQRRIAERLIGPFDFTGGRSFDGVRGAWNVQALGGLGISAFRPTQGGFATDSSSQIEDITVVTAALSADPKLFRVPSDLQLFYYFYQDERGAGILKTDNRPLEARQADLDDISLHNFGFHWINVLPRGDVSFDHLLWAVAQTGEWGVQDHLAAATAVEAGLRWEKVAGRPWLRAGYNFSTGDRDAEDGDHTTFFQMLPTARQYAEVPFYNLMNNEELFTNLSLEVTERLSLRAGASYLWVSENEDLLYSGGGATKDRQFGYAGAPAAASDELGALVALHTWYKISEAAQVYLFYGRLFGGDALDTAFSRRDIDYAFAELNIKF